MGLAKIAGYHWCEIKLSCFFQSLTGCNNTSFLLGREKGWVSFPAITGYFVKLNCFPEKPPTDYLYGRDYPTKFFAYMLDFLSQ